MRSEPLTFQSDPSESQDESEAPNGTAALLSKMNYYALSAAEVQIQEVGDENMIKQKYKQLGEANKLNTLGNWNFVQHACIASDRRPKSNIYQ